MYCLTPRRASDRADSFKQEFGSISTLDTFEMVVGSARLLAMTTVRVAAFLIDDRVPAAREFAMCEVSGARARAFD